MLPYGLHEAFHPVFEIVDFLNEYQFTESNGKRMKITDLCFLIRHYDSFLLGEEAKFLPRDGCLQISPANLWNDVASFHTDKDIVSKIYGKSRDNVSLKENIFGVPLQAIGLFPLPGSNECLVIRYAVTIVLEEFHQNFMENMKKNLHNKFPAIVEVERSSTLVHIHYEGENIIEIYHLCFVYFIVFIYLGFSLSKIEMVKSKLGLALSAVVTVVASLAMAAGLCVFFGVVPSLSSRLSEIFPYLVIIIGLENILVITRSIVSTHPCLPVPVRVAEGLSREGRSITLNLVTELLLLLFGYFTFVPVVQEFCMVGGVGVLTDFFLQIVFFATVLSIDLSRLEPSTQYMKSPHVEINVSNSMRPTQKPSNVTEAKALPEKTAVHKANNWSDVWAYLCNPKKIFSLRQDLPKRLNFAYFWARTRIAQRGIMVFAIVYFIYITSSTISFTEESSTGMKEKNSNGNHSNTHSKNVSKQELFNTSASFNKVKFLYSYVTESKEKRIKKERRNLDSCDDKFKRTGFWRNLSRQHWPEFLDLYGINLMDRYITVLPQINLQFKMNKTRLTDNTN
ncbi:sterol regulatory element-binding protein cleavage-activating protein-like isoform X2 [Xenia sp. Carnegie-2017]|nr:sterol regulatory element-binding protein cleavage-activating protein-like isoform X2 [Xenia sp. Carnegie-2017]